MCQALCIEEVLLKVLQGGARFVLVLSVPDPVWTASFVKCSNEMKKDVTKYKPNFLKVYLDKKKIALSNGCGNF